MGISFYKRSQPSPLVLLQLTFFLLKLFLTPLPTADAGPFASLQHVIFLKALGSCDEQSLRTHDMPGPALGSEDTVGNTRGSWLSTEHRVSGKVAG